MKQKMKVKQLTLSAIEAQAAAKRLQVQVTRRDFWHGFINDCPMLLLAGLVEEVGELAEVINANEHIEFGTCPSKVHLLDDVNGNIAAEICDVLTYVLALANHYDVDLTFDNWIPKDA